MPELSNRRHYNRVNVGEEYTVRFRIGEKSFTGLTMTNLSAGGCCFRIQSSEAEEMERGSVISVLYLVHPHIPSVPLQASVRWLLGRQPGRSEGFLLVGVEFIHPSPKFQETLDAYVSKLLR